MIGLAILNPEVKTMLGVIFGILTFFTLFFIILKKLKPNFNTTELMARTKSWWVIFTLISSALLIGKGFIISMLAFLSFVALREFFSIIPLEISDRKAVLISYLSIPVQFYAVYITYYEFFISWVPVTLFMILAMRKIAVGDVSNYTKSLSVLLFSNILIVFSIGHLAYILVLDLPVMYSSYNEGLFLYLIFLVQFNDVLQFICGKLFGKNRITPTVSPNKTWEGFIGGMILTMILGYFFRFLTFFTPLQAIGISFVIAFTGFFGDLNISAIKRDIGIKDMGNAIPGHGGFMDRLDSLSLASLAYFHIVHLWSRVHG